MVILAWVGILFVVLWILGSIITFLWGERSTIISQFTDYRFHWYDLIAVPISYTLIYFVYLCMWPWLIPLMFFPKDGNYDES